MYIKTKITDDIEINIQLYSDQIYCKCPVCGVEVNVDADQLLDILENDGDLTTTAVYCDPCSEKYRANKGA